MGGHSQHATGGAQVYEAGRPTRAAMRVWSSELGLWNFYMQAANVVAMEDAKQLGFVSGATGAVYAPRQLLALWYRMVGQNHTGGAHQEIFFPTMILATALEPDVEPFRLTQVWGDQGTGSKSKELAANASAIIAEGWWWKACDFHSTHPWKTGNSQEARQLMADRLEVYFTQGRAPNQAEANIARPLPRAHPDDLYATYRGVSKAAEWKWDG
jgi:hypothetical protein